MTYHDDELIYLYRQGNDWAFELLERHFRPMMLKLVRQFAAGVYGGGFDEEEGLQECQCCFYACIDDYCETKNATFATYCYTRMQYALMNYRSRYFSRCKHEADMTGDLMEKLAFDEQVYRSDPLKMLDYQHHLAVLKQLQRESKGIERDVIACLMIVETSREMGKHLPYEQRRINNALYRIRKKLRILRQ